MAGNAGIYLRISEDREGRELGVVRQDEDCHALAERRGDTVVDRYKDNDISASTRSKKPRPEYKRLLDDARAGRIDTVIAYTSGRLTRRPREHEDQIQLAERYGVQFVYVASPTFDLNTAAGRRVARILAATDAGEAEDIGERISRMKEQMQAQGRPTGGPRPFGFESDHIQQRPDEAAAIADAIRRVLNGDSLRSIWVQWNEQGLLTSRGTTWNGTTFRQMLERPRNAGLVGSTRAKTMRVVGPGVWDPVVDPAMWDAFMKLISDPARTVNGGNTSRRLLGSWLFRCECGQLMASGGNTSTGRPRYACVVNKHSCRLAEPVDDLVHRMVERILQLRGPSLIRASVDVTPLRDRLVLLRAKAEDIASEFGDPDGGMTRAQFKIANDPVQEKIREAEAELSRASAGSALAGIADATDPVRAYRAQGVDRHRAIIGGLMTVTLMHAPAGRRPGGGYFDSESVRITPKES